MKGAIWCLVLFHALAWSLPTGEEELEFNWLYSDLDIELPEDVSPRITNGIEAVPHSVPYQAYVIVHSPTDTQRWLCGGALISSVHLLTAAHCLQGGSRVTVYLGAHNIRERETTQVIVKSSNIIMHADYNKTALSNDIGLVTFDAPVELNEYIGTIGLPSLHESATYQGANAMVSGWGRVSGNGAASAVLLEVNSTIISNTSCKRYFSRVIDSHICISGSGGVGSCTGDSGGPLVVGNALVGLVSYGGSGCPSGSPSASTRITSFLHWIQEHSGLSL